MSLARRRDRVCIAVLQRENLNGFLGRANPICKERTHSVFFGAVLNGAMFSCVVMAGRLRM